MEEIKASLTRLKLSGMTACLKTLEETLQIHKLSFTDGFKLLIQAETDTREITRLERLTKNATFRTHHRKYRMQEKFPRYRTGNTSLQTKIFGYLH
jgi:hypothetical protein